MNCSKIIKNNKKNIVAEEDKKPFKVFYFKDCDNEGDKLFEVAILKFSKV